MLAAATVVAADCCAVCKQTIKPPACMHHHAHPTRPHIAAAASNAATALLPFAAAAANKPALLKPALNAKASSVLKASRMLQLYGFVCRAAIPRRPNEKRRQLCVHTAGCGRNYASTQPINQLINQTPLLPTHTSRVVKATLCVCVLARRGRVGLVVVGWRFGAPPVGQCGPNTPTYIHAQVTRPLMQALTLHTNTTTHNRAAVEARQGDTQAARRYCVRRQTPP